MPDDVIKIGDELVFNPTFGPAIAAGNMKATIIQGAEQAKTGGKKYCTVPPTFDQFSTPLICSYTKGPYTGGTGQIVIASLAADQRTKKYKINNKQVILKGKAPFNAVLKVISPAINASTGDPDVFPPNGYPGTGRFIPKNPTFKAE